METVLTLIFLGLFAVGFGSIVYTVFFIKKIPTPMSTWEKVATYCWETFGSHVNWEEEFFICPDCQEPIYNKDWNNFCDNLAERCPICDYEWYATEEENDERKAAGNEWYVTEEDAEMDEIDNEHDDNEEEE